MLKRQRPVDILQKEAKKECQQTNGELDGQANNKSALPTYIDDEAGT